MVRKTSTGYYGRQPVFETLPMDDEVIGIMADNFKSHELKQKLRDYRKSVLLDEARKMILDGSTSCVY